MLRKRDYSLEGLRGVASLSVVFAHFLYAFAPYLAIYTRPGLEIPVKFGWEPILALPIISLLYNASFAVSVFFVLSGYVLTKRFFDHGDAASLGLSAVKRYPRLIIPVCAATMLAFVLYATGMMHNGTAGNIGAAGWPMAYYDVPISFRTALYEALYGTPFMGVNQLVGPLWTIKIEVVGSLLLLATYALFGRRSPPLNLFMFSALAMCIAPQSEYLLHYFAIFVGSLIHYWERWLRRSAWLAACLLVFGLISGSFDYSPILAAWHSITLPSLAAPLMSLQASKRTFYESIGAIFLVSGVIGFAPAARLLASRMPAYLGRISFSLYLLHWPIIFSLSFWLMDYFILQLGWTYGTALTVTASVTLTVILLCSDLFERFVDSPAIRIANKAANRMGRQRLEAFGKSMKSSSIADSDVLHRTTEDPMLPVTPGDLEKTADHWAETYQSTDFARREWIGHPLAIKRLVRIMNGHNTHAQWLVDAHLKGKSVSRALGIGVGVAFHENQIVAAGFAEHYDYYDVTQAGLDIARTAAEEQGIADRISFICADVNTAELPAEGYGLITFMASMHHIHELEKTLRACERALAPGGMLWAFEYVGPDRFNYPDEHADIARRLFRILDADIRLPGEPELKFPTPEEVIAVDPTEAVHSSEILSTMRQIWPDLEVIGQYGSLSSMMMWCLNHNALYDTAKGYEAYGTILELENALVDSGALPHYFVTAIARKPARENAATQGDADLPTAAG